MGINRLAAERSYRLAISYLEECLEIPHRESLTETEFDRVMNGLN